MEVRNDGYALTMNMLRMKAQAATHAKSIPRDEFKANWVQKVFEKKGPLLLAKDPAVPGPFGWLQWHGAQLSEACYWPAPWMELHIVLNSECWPEPCVVWLSWKTVQSKLRVRRVSSCRQPALRTNAAQLRSVLPRMGRGYMLYWEETEFPTKFSRGNQSVPKKRGGWLCAGDERSGRTAQAPCWPSSDSWSWRASVVTWRTISRNNCTRLAQTWLLFQAVSQACCNHWTSAWSGLLSLNTKHSSTRNGWQATSGCQPDGSRCHVSVSNVSHCAG